jgi:predicted enzyme related to lactoylglutathione lyase
MGAPVVHFEIISKNADQLQKFFSELFDWKIDTNNPQGYGLIDTQAEGGIPGGIGGPPPGQEDYPGHVTFYVMVDDPQKYLDRAEKLGGKTLMPPMEVPGADGVTLAMFADPDGHLIGLTKST